MFYKFIEVDNYWNLANKISFPDGITLDENNKIAKDGWFWSDEEPEEYKKWKNEQENI
tara:strand:+ start:4048 stop:4221 length:174 start_codon:yes stop_codon:yes gene_type:complete